MLLTIPIWPLFGGIIYVKEKNQAPDERRIVVSDNSSLEDGYYVHAKYWDGTGDGVSSGGVSAWSGTKNGKTKKK